MKISFRDFAKALVLPILVTSFFVARHVYWVVTNPDFYSSIFGTFWIVGIVPYSLVDIGCLLFLLQKGHGLPLILVGGVLSFFGTTWSYTPYLPAISADPAVRILNLAVGNLSVLALLLWSSRMQSNYEFSVGQ